MVRTAAGVLAAVAALGWFLCVVVSLLAFVGVVLPGHLAEYIIYALFPVWLFAVLVINRITRGAGKHHDKALYRGCPALLRYAIWGSYGYSLLMILLIVAGVGAGEGVMLGFMGAFFATALGAFVTAARVGVDLIRCSNGHVVGPFAKYCGECGVELRPIS